MSDKKLTIGAELKLKATEAENAMKRLSKQASEISKAVKGLDEFPKAGGGKGGFSKKLVDVNKEMLKFKGSIKDTANDLDKSYGRSLERQTKRIEFYIKKMDELNKKLKDARYNQQFYSEIGNTSMASFSANQATQAQNMLSVLQKWGRNLPPGALPPPPPPPPSRFPKMNPGMWPGIKPGAGSYQDDVSVPPPNAPPASPGAGPTGGGSRPPFWDWQMARKGTKIGRAIADGVEMSAHTYQSLKTLGDQNKAQLRDFERNLLGKMAGGDFSDLYFATRKVGDKTLLKHAKDEYGGTLAATIEGGANVAGGALQAVGGAILLRGAGGAASGASVGATTQGSSSIVSGINNVATGTASLFKGGPEITEMNTMASGLKANKLQDPMTQMALQWISSTAGMRVGAAKSLQGRHMGAWGIGQGFGLDMGESFSAANQLARQFGVNAALGVGGTTRTDVRAVQDAGIWRTPQQFGVIGHSLSMQESMALDRVGLRKDELRRQGYEEFDKVNDFTLFKKQVNEGGREGLLRSVLGLERKGMDRGVAGTALGTMMMATGGNLGAANRQLEDVMTKAFGRGLTDARLGEEIVRATGDSAFGRGGAIQNMAAVGMMLSGGLGSGSTMHEVQSNLGGAKAFDSLIKGNSYFSAVQLEAAKRTLGSNATGTQMLAIQRATMADLVGGSQQLELAGITSEQRRQILGQTANSLMGTYLTNSQDPATADLRKALSSNGGDIIKTLQGGNRGLMEQFALALSLNSGMGQSESEGLARVLAGVDSKADLGSSRRNYADRGDAVAESTVRAQQSILNEFFKKETEIRDEYLKALRAAKPLAETIGNNDATYEAFQKFFTQFMEIMQKAMQDPRIRSQLVGGVVQKGG